MMTVASITWTRFLDKGASSARELKHDWRELVEHLQHAGPYAAKAVCPWIKLARFGTARSGKGALRHDGNLVEITGVEGDYDGEQMQPEEALQLLERANLCAVVYTSPSHKPDAPRWRVLAPLSHAHQPADRTRLLARVNGALGGVLTGESFTLSQSYYYGRVAGQADYRVLVTFDDPDEGNCVDLADELDAVAVAKAPRVHMAESGNGSAHVVAAKVEQLGRRLRTGDGRRELLKSYIGDKSNRGLSADEVRTLVDDLVSRFFDSSDPVDWSNINGLITDITDADGAQRAQVQATVGGFVERVTAAAVPPAAIAPLDLLSMAGHPAEPMQFIVDKWLPARAVTVLTAHGGVGKSTMSLQLAVCLAKGLPWFGIQTTQSKVLLVSCEDAKEAIHWRLANVCTHLGLSMADLHGLVEIYDMTEQDCVLWARGQATARMQWLEDVCVRSGAGCIIVDNASDTFADNENDRTAVRGFVRALAKIAIQIDGALLLLAHVDKASARGVVESTDNYSGSTAWNNSARSRWAMSRNKDDSIAISNEKNNYAARQEPFRVEYDPVQHAFVDGDAGGPRFASDLIRNQSRLDIMKAVLKANESCANLSLSRQANNNAHGTLRKSYGLSKSMDVDDFWGYVDTLLEWKFIEVEQYQQSNRTIGKRLVLTEAGRGSVARSSGAHPVWMKEESA